MCYGWIDEKAKKNIVTNTEKIIQTIEKLIPGTLHRSRESSSCGDIFCSDATFTRRSVYLYYSNDSPLLRKGEDEEYVAYDIIHAGFIDADIDLSNIKDEYQYDYATFVTFTVSDTISASLLKYNQYPEGYDVELIRNKYDGTEAEVRLGLEGAFTVERKIRKPVLMYMQFINLYRYFYRYIDELCSKVPVKEIFEYVVLMDNSDDKTREMVEKWVNYEITTSQLIKYVYSKTFGEIRGSGGKIEVIYPFDKDVFYNIPLPETLRKAVLAIDNSDRYAALLYSLIYALPFVVKSSIKRDDFIHNNEPISLEFDDGTKLEIRDTVFYGYIFGLASDERRKDFENKRDPAIRDIAVTNCLPVTLLPSDLAFFERIEEKTNKTDVCSLRGCR